MVLANLRIIDTVHRLLNEEGFHFVPYRTVGRYCLLQRWVDGLEYEAHVGPDLAIAVVISVQTLETEIFVFQMTEYPDLTGNCPPQPLWPAYPHAFGGQSPTDIVERMLTSILWLRCEADEFRLYPAGLDGSFWWESRKFEPYKAGSMA
jgi:hypothetical protein